MFVLSSKIRKEYDFENGKGMGIFIWRQAREMYSEYALGTPIKAKPGYWWERLSRAGIGTEGVVVRHLQIGGS